MSFFSTEFYIGNSEIIQKDIFFSRIFLIERGFIPTMSIMSRLEMVHGVFSPQNFTLSEII